MSDLYYTTRLRFEGWSGCAMLHGVRVKLHTMPTLPGIDAMIAAVDYVPEIGMKQIQPLAGPWRDMTTDEVRAADEVLRVLVSAP